MTGVPMGAAAQPLTTPRVGERWPDSPDNLQQRSPSAGLSTGSLSTSFHPSRILDEVAAREQAEGSWTLNGIPTGLTDVGPSTSYVGKKRRRDDDEDVDDGLSSWSSTEEDTDPETENNG